MYQSIIINLISEKNDLTKIIETLKNYHSKLDSDGTLWIITKTEFENGEMIPVPFQLVESLNNYFLKNIMIVPNFEKSFNENIFSNCIYYILFLSKNKKYYFNKDPIREKHIWKNVEWGKREKNYHSLGKDPGNVWLKTEDNGEGKITSHIQLPFNEVIDRVIKISNKQKTKCLLINIPSNMINVEEVDIEYGKI